MSYQKMVCKAENDEIEEFISFSYEASSTSCINDVISSLNMLDDMRALRLKG